MKQLQFHTSGTELRQARFYQMERSWASANAGWRLSLYCPSKEEDRPPANILRHWVLATWHITE